MGWCRVLFVLSIVCATAYSKALTSNENVRKSRQLDSGECCPCSKPRADVSEEPSYLVKPIIDDCPCRDRAADSEGASSIMSPALQALRPFIRPDGLKAGPEPLLKPEVGLASSVLKTLQEVTNEEYEDALARDATRSVVKALETDFPLLQSEDIPGSIINIILNPKETGTDLEVQPEASHLQEIRCIHPLGSTYNKRNNFKSTLFRESNKNLQPGGRKSNARSDDFDMDNQASEIQNSLQKSSTGFMESFYEPKESENSQEYVADPTSENNSVASKISDLKLSTIVDSIKKSIQSNSLLNKVAKKAKNAPVSDDGTDTPTVMEEKPHKLAFKHLQNVFDRIEKPTHLKNFLKMKDVELIPKRNTVRAQKIKENSVQYNDDSLMNAFISSDEKTGGQQDNTQTENLDAIPSSSKKIESERTNAVLLKRTENNACDDFNVIMATESLRTEKQNNRQTSEQGQHEIIDEINNSSRDVNLLPNEFNEPITEPANSHQISRQNIAFSSNSATSTLKDNLKGSQSEEKQDKNILPLIKDDIIKSFKNFEQDNEDMQEKLRYNLQDFMQVVDTDSNKMIDSRLSKDSKKSTSITEDDLQKMSDSILNESNIKTKNLKSSFKEANERHKFDNCVPTGNNKQDVVDENTFNGNPSDESVTQFKSLNLNDTTDEQNTITNDMNKNDDMNKEDNNRKSVLKTSDDTPTVNNISNEGIMNRNSKDFTDSSFEVPNFPNNPQDENIIDLNPSDNSALERKSSGIDLETDMSKINDKITTNVPNESMSNEENKCLQNDSNDMNVQASEPIGKQISFAKPDFSILKPDRSLAPKLSIGSGFKPYSARLASPHSLDRDTIHPNLSSRMSSLQNTVKNNNLKNVFKNLETGVTPTFRNNKHSDIFISKPFDEFNSISDNFKSHADESLKNLNNFLSSDTGELKSNQLYKNVMNNADNIRHSLSRAHNDLNNKLQQLHSDWTDKIHAIGQRTDTPLPLRPVATSRKNIFYTEKKIPSLSFEKPRTESNIMKGNPKTLLNDQKFKLPQLLPKTLYKAPSLGERRATFLTTTKRPQPILTIKRPPRKEVSLKFAPKPSLSRSLQDAIESAKSRSDKLNDKIRDMKTLPSNVKPIRVRNQDYSAKKSIPEPQESLENPENVQPYFSDNDFRGTEDSRNVSISRNNGLPFQLKAEEFSILKQLLDGIRSSQRSDQARNNDDYEDNANENLQASSHNIENFKMPENTLKENVSYKCKMVCSKDNK